MALGVSVLRTSAAFGAYAFPQVVNVAPPIHDLLDHLPIILLLPEVWYFAIFVGVALSDGSAQGKWQARLIAIVTLLATIFALRGQLM
jgi:hypothetical protein